MGRIVVTLAGVLVLAVVAGGLTEATLAIGHRGGLVDDITLRPAAKAIPHAVSVSPSVTPVPTPTATPVTTPVPTVAPTAPIATTNSFVHIRAGKSTTSNILANLDGGTKVELLADTDASWQQVQYNGVIGYIFKTYLTY